MRVGAAVRVPFPSLRVGTSTGNNHRKLVRGGAHHYCFFIALSWRIFLRTYYSQSVRSVPVVWTMAFHLGHPGSTQVNEHSCGTFRILPIPEIVQGVFGLRTVSFLQSCVGPPNVPVLRPRIIHPNTSAPPVWRLTQSWRI